MVSVNCGIRFPSILHAHMGALLRGITLVKGNTVRNGAGFPAHLRKNPSTCNCESDYTRNQRSKKAENDSFTS